MGDVLGNILEVEINIYSKGRRRKTRTAGETKVDRKNSTKLKTNRERGYENVTVKQVRKKELIKTGTYKWKKSTSQYRNKQCKLWCATLPFE